MKPCICSVVYKSGGHLSFEGFLSTAVPAGARIKQSKLSAYFSRVLGMHIITQRINVAACMKEPQHFTRYRLKSFFSIVLHVYYLQAGAGEPRGQRCWPFSQRAISDVDSHCTIPV